MPPTKKQKTASPAQVVAAFKQCDQKIDALVHLMKDLNRSVDGKAMIHWLKAYLQNPEFTTIMEDLHRR